MVIRKNVIEFKDDRKFYKLQFSQYNMATRTNSNLCKNAIVAVSILGVFN